jgi:hypothetical protein
MIGRSLICGDEIAMTVQVYCYHCRRCHPAGEMQWVQNHGKKRWRCRSSLDSVRASREQRDAFGRMVSAMNQRNLPRSLPHCVRELFGIASFEIAGLP